MDPYVPGITGQSIEHLGTELAPILPVLHNYPIGKGWPVPVPAGTSFPVKPAVLCKLRGFSKPYSANITVIPAMDLNASGQIICSLLQNLLPVHLGCNICDNGCTVHPTEARRHI
nr:hypothetical protein Iba_chr04eCG19350 [Ipomoea batatas]